MKQPLRRTPVPMALVVAAVTVSLLLAGCTGGRTHTAGAPSSRPGSPVTQARAPAGGPEPPAPSTTLAGPPDGPPAVGFQPSSATFTSAQEGWALGATTCAGHLCTAVARTRDAGHTWRVIPAPLAGFDATPGRLGTGSGVFGLRFADAADGWAFGSELWATHDGGSTWRAVRLPGLDAAHRVTAVAAGDGVVYAAVFGQGGAQVLRSAVGADTWSPVARLTSPAEPSLVLAGGRAWLVAAGQPGGPEWLSATSPASGAWVPGRGPCPSTATGGLFAAAGAAAPAPTSVTVACAGPSGAGQEDKAVFVSADAGVHFVPVGNAPRSGHLEALASPAPATIVVASASGASTLSGTFDGGRSWSTVFGEASGGIPFEDLGFTTASQGFVVMGVPSAMPLAGLPPSRLLMTRDGGHTWAPSVFGG